MEVGFGPDHILLDGDPSPLLWPNDWMDQDATWYGGRHRPRPRCARLGPNSTSPQKGRNPPHPIFGPYVYCGQWPYEWMHQDTTWYGGRSRPRQHCVRWVLSSPHGKGHSSPHPYFSVHFALAGSPISATALLLLNVLRTGQRCTIRFNGGDERSLRDIIITPDGEVKD